MEPLSVVHDGTAIKNPTVVVIFTTRSLFADHQCLCLTLVLVLTRANLQSGAFLSSSRNQELDTEAEVAFSHRQPQVLQSGGDIAASCVAPESEGVFDARLNRLHGLTGPFPSVFFDITR